MKTIVFHSYKGGVGRTMALANLGIALSKIGKKVLMLDWDFDAPGLAFKWGVEQYVKKGYVDYLAACSRHYTNLAYADHGDRAKFLEKYIIDIKGYNNLYLLPAGDTSCRDYWQKLASSHFRQFFTYHGDEEKEEKRLIQSFFQDDISIFSKLRGGIEYLIIDCKGGIGYISAPPIMQWSDQVVEFFNANKEGVFGDLLIRGSLQELARFSDRTVELTSVMSRVAHPFSRQQSLSKYLDIKAGIQTPTFEFEIEPPKKLEIIYEQRNLEIVEELSLASIDNTQIEHDYIELYESIFCHDEQVKNKIKSIDGIDWKDALGVGSRVII